MIVIRFANSEKIIATSESCNQSLLAGKQYNAFRYWNSRVVIFFAYSFDIRFSPSGEYIYAYAMLSCKKRRELNTANINSMADTHVDMFYWNKNNDIRYGA